MKIFIRYSLFVIPALGAMMSFVIFCLTFYSDVNAQTMSNSSYKLETGNFNPFAGKATGNDKSITFTGGQNTPGLYSGTNYQVHAGFAYDPSGQTTTSFSFSISDTSVNFGQLVPGEPIIRTNSLIISSPSSGYQVLASEANPLRMTTGKTDIPDTACDAGNCTEVTSGLWTSPLSYGFGYRCDNLQATDCASDFANLDYYKQLANLEAKEEPQIVMSNAKAIGTSKTQITYKTNVAGTQKPGVYQNIIIYIATPSI